MSGKKMDAHRALAVLYYNYPVLTVVEDAEWTDYMVEMLTEDPKADKRDVCMSHGLKYPPRWWMELYFGERVIANPRW